MKAPCSWQKLHTELGCKRQAHLAMFPDVNQQQGSVPLGAHVLLVQAYDLYRTRSRDWAQRVTLAAPSMPPGACPEHSMVADTAGSGSCISHHAVLHPV